MGKNRPFNVITDTILAAAVRLTAAGCIFIILITCMIVSCKEEVFPLNLVISGITGETLSGDIVTMEEKQKELRLLVRGEATAQTLSISPWKDFGVFNDLPYTIEARQYYEPGGPIKTLKFFQNSGLVVLICDNVERLPAPLGEVRLLPGKTIKGKESSNRTWVNIVVTTGQTEKTLAPGNSCDIALGETKWKMVLVGASIPADKGGVLSGKKGISPEEGEPEGIASEDSPFAVDCIIYKSE
ncbi:MAG: hypothetical protein JXJ04_12710 [Spirochaetales bacterium]|nr:hypothetical protein [Spirochaetales bacterium]